MPETQFEALRLELLKRGIAPLYAGRTIEELEEHYADLEAAALTAGRTPSEAAAIARELLGSEEAIVSAALLHPELLAWSKRWPRTAHCLQSAAAIGALPGVPLIYCIEHRPELTRWSTSLGAATILVSGVLTVLDWLLVVH
jgi:hypothetical protein